MASILALNGCPESVDHYSIPLVRQSNLDGDKVDLSKCVYLDEQYLIERAGFTLHKGDVLIGMSGSVGKLCTYDQDFAALQNQRVGKIELHAPDQTEWRFIWHYLKTVTDALLDKAKGVAVANVSPDDIHSLPLNIPPLAEQTRVAAKLEPPRESWRLVGMSHAVMASSRCC